MSDLPPLSASELKALDELNLTPILGTVEEQLRLAMHKAIQFMRERNTARAGEKMAWSEHAKAQAEADRLRDRLAAVNATANCLCEQAAYITDTANDTLRDLAECRRLLREAVEVSRCDDEWFGNQIEDEWFEAARKAAGGDDE